LSAFENLANRPFSTTAAQRVSFLFSAIDGLHVEGIVLKVLKNEGRIADWKIVREYCHHTKEIILELIGLREQCDLVKTPQFRIRSGIDGGYGRHIILL
jgi:ribosomal protein S8